MLASHAGCHAQAPPSLAGVQRTVGVSTEGNRGPKEAGATLCLGIETSCFVTSQ